MLGGDPSGPAEVRLSLSSEVSCSTAMPADWAGARNDGYPGVLAKRCVTPSYDPHRGNTNSNTALAVEGTGYLDNGLPCTRPGTDSLENLGASRRTTSCSQQLNVARTQCRGNPYNCITAPTVCVPWGILLVGIPTPGAPKDFKAAIAEPIIPNSARPLPARNPRFHKQLGGEARKPLCGLRWVCPSRNLDQVANSSWGGTYPGVLIKFPTVIVLVTLLIPGYPGTESMKLNMQVEASRKPNHFRKGAKLRPVKSITPSIRCIFVAG
eukprot:3708641-Rhodomonas_salina.2